MSDGGLLTLALPLSRFVTSRAIDVAREDYGIAAGICEGYSEKCVSDREEELGPGESLLQGCSCAYKCTLRREPKYAVRTGLVNVQLPPSLA
jgi:hypothetical protein